MIKGMEVYVVIPAHEDGQAHTSGTRLFAVRQDAKAFHDQLQNRHGGWFLTRIVRNDDRERVRNIAEGRRRAKAGSAPAGYAAPKEGTDG